MDHSMVCKGGHAVQAEPTVQCPEAGSDKMKLPGGPSPVHREAPILSKMNTPPFKCLQERPPIKRLVANHQDNQETSHNMK